MLAEESGHVMSIVEFHTRDIAALIKSAKPEVNTEAPNSNP